MDTPGGRLRYTTDSKPGYRRVPRGREFDYRDTAGHRVRGAADNARIRAIGIPPAWADVWICPDERGHLQATGRDARGRKQYRYHTAYRAERDAGKFDRLREFGEALPAIRRKVRAHLALPGLPREKVLAIIVSLLDRTAIRVGNERYARDNDSFGLTTLRNRHVSVKGPRIEFTFRGKGGKPRRVTLDDPRLAKLVRRCRDLPGYELFQYVDEAGERRSIDSADVNDYLREVSGAEVTAKDFRTWRASVCAACAIARAQDPAKRGVVTAAIAEAATLLGNTPTICRKSYVHPSVLLPTSWFERVQETARKPRGVDSGEALLLRILDMAREPLAKTLRASIRRHGWARPKENIARNRAVAAGA